MSFLTDLFTNPFSFILWLLALVIAVDIHEFAHSFVADKLGDPTPRINGRLTLNPLAHLDPLGTLALLLFHVGWGKPVPIDPFNLRHPRRDAGLISLAGPASNLIFAIILSLIIRLPLITNYQPASPTGGLLITFLISLIILSVGLAVFNLIPVPPLDGAKILFGFLPPELSRDWEETLNQYGLIILILLLFPIFGGEPLVNLIVWPIINFVLNLLLPASFGLPLV
jgi:Zn-dependent protease